MVRLVCVMSGAVREGGGERVAHLLVNKIPPDERTTSMR